MEEALIEMYLAGVSIRRIRDITETLWRGKVSPATISELNKKAYVHIAALRIRQPPSFQRQSRQLDVRFYQFSMVVAASSGMETVFLHKMKVERLLLRGMSGIITLNGI